jgi:hypothetical protein
MKRAELYSKPTLESIINLFKKHLNIHKRDEELELEIRYNVNYNEFLIILKYLLENGKKLLVPEILYAEDIILEPSINMMISAINDDRKNNSMIRKDITFHNNRDKTTKFISKKLLSIPPYIVYALDYKISLALEQIVESTVIYDSSIIRIKYRLSFPLHLQSSEDPNIVFIWRIDLTIILEISNPDKETIINWKNKFFKDNTIEHFQFLLLKEEISYKYEIEIELITAITKTNEEVKPALATIKEIDVNNAINIILNIKNPEYNVDMVYQKELHTIAKNIIQDKSKLYNYVQSGTLKQLLPQVKSLTKNIYDSIYPPKNFYITDKADGLRCIIIIRNGLGLLMLSDKILHFTPSIEVTDSDCVLDTILDGEYIAGAAAASRDTESAIGVGDTAAAAAIPEGSHFYGFDIISFNGINVSNHGFTERLKYLETGIIIVNKIFGEHFSEVKPMYLIEDESPEYLEPLIRQAYESPRPYEKDGLIFISNNAPYKTTESYKWKPLKDMTIDFLAKKIPRELCGLFPYIEKEGYNLYILFVGINNRDMEKFSFRIIPHYTKMFKMDIGDRVNYRPIQFTLSDVPYAHIYYHPKTGAVIDNKIIELRCAGDCAAAGGRSMLVDWELVKIREDRQESKLYYGNDYKTAESNWSNYIDPFVLEDLWEPTKNKYFMHEKEERYTAQVKVINYSKEHIISELKNSEWIIDIGAGKGQDLGRYYNSNIKNLIAIDVDCAAINTLIKRRSETRYEKGKKYTSVNTIIADINTEDPIKLVEKCNNLGMGLCNAIVCNLAFHYFLGTTETINNFITIADKSIAENGKVCITCFNGKKIHDLFIKENISLGNSWELRENGLLKYSLIRRYSSSKLECCGQKIGVLLPFLRGDYYDEYLYNHKDISAMFGVKGFHVEKITSLDEYISHLEIHNKRLFSQLTENDKIYLSLFCEVIYTRGATTRGSLATKKVKELKNNKMVSIKSAEIDTDEKKEKKEKKGKKEKNK